MISFNAKACLLVAVAILGITADSEVELSSSMLDCLEEVHPLYREFVALDRKCERKYPISTKVFNRNRNKGGTVDTYQEDRQKCMAHFKTPKVTAKLADIKERCGKIISSLTDSQFERVEALFQQEVWPRV